MARRARIAALTALAVAVCGSGYVIAHRIEPLLPAPGTSKCFAGAADAKPLAIGFPHLNNPKDVYVRSVTLKLSLEPGQEPYRDPTTGYRFDWRYDFDLLAETTDGGNFRSQGQCDWLGGALASIENTLFCFIDCDGGGIAISKMARPYGVSLDFAAGGWLRMSSCGDGGEILRARKETVSFEVPAALDQVCAEKLPPNP